MLRLRPIRYGFAALVVFCLVLQAGGPSGKSVQPAKSRSSAAAVRGTLHAPLLSPLSQPLSNASSPGKRLTGALAPQRLRVASALLVWEISLQPARRLLTGIVPNQSGRSPPVSL